MKRLTKRLNNGKELCIEVCGEQCVEGYTWCPKCKPFSDVMKKLADYEDAEEQEKLIRLSCKVGSTLYDIIDFVEGSNYPEIYVIDASKIEVSRDKKGVLYTIDCADFREEEFGTIVFSSMEEAEQALERMVEEDG